MCFDNMSTWAIVPVKRLREAKSGLSGVLTPEQRRELVLCMLTDVLNALGHAPSISGKVVVSPDDEVLTFARSKGADGVADKGLELNEALKLGVQHASAKGARSVLIVPADLPLLKSSDIENIIAMASSSKSIVIAPSKANGTNALFLMPPDVMSLRFGGESFPIHLAEARSAGIVPHVYRSPTVATDIDKAVDLLSVETLGLGTRTQNFLAATGLKARI
jgi:2-phospho-L-lactate guanylyltransferase